MNKLLITYTLHKKGQDYQSLYDIIEHFPHTKVGTSSYVILADDVTPSQMWILLRDKIDANDNLGIFLLGGAWGGRVEPDSAAWLEKNLVAG